MSPSNRHRAPLSSTTIVWGHSLGGMITAGLVQRDPQRFAGALPMCGVLAGGVGTWNEGLDGEFVASTLLMHDPSLQLVNIQDPDANFEASEAMLAAAQETPQGRARLALSAAVGDLPGWFDSTSPEPAATDYPTQVQNQFLWDQQADFPFIFAFRQDMEQRAGGTLMERRRRLSTAARPVGRSRRGRGALSRGGVVAWPGLAHAGEHATHRGRSTRRRLHDAQHRLRR